jgi:alcohol dehydrogenase class IV
MAFSFATAGRITFGPGSVDEVGSIAASFGRRALMVTGADPSRAQRIEALMSAQSVEVEGFRVRSEPTVDVVREGLACVRRAGPDVVIGCGGGSAIDAAKAIAALAKNDGDPMEYLEVIGEGRPLVHPGIPVIAVPTTAGTGAEVTRNAVLLSPAERVKVSLRSSHLLPRVALVDPQMSADMPLEVTAASGLDALTQLIESFTTQRRNPITDGFCREGLRRVGSSLVNAYHHGDTRAREDMALASLLSGLALANSGLGAVHGFAGPIGGRYAAPHGAVCAALLPHVMRLNLSALQSRQPTSGVLDRYDEIARLLTGRPDAAAQDGLAWINQLCRELNVRPLRDYGVQASEIQELIAEAEHSSSMRGNPIGLAHQDMQEILDSAL